MDGWWINYIPGWLILSLISVSLLVYRYVIIPLSYFKDHGIYSPKAMPILGHIPYLQKGVHIFDQENYSKCKDKKVFGMLLGTKKQLVLCDLDLIKNVVIKDADIFTNRMRFSRINDVFAKMLTALNDDHWKHVRAAITPTFSSGKLRRMNTLIHNCSTKLVDNLGEYCDRDEVVCVKSIFGAFSMDTIASTMFGIEVDSIKDPANPFVLHAKQMMSFTGKGFQIFFILMFSKLIYFMEKLGIVIYADMKRALKFFTDVTTRVLEERAKSDDESYADFLQLMVKCRVTEKDIDSQTGNFKWSTKGLLDDEIVAQSIVFLLAGYENMASVLSFTAHVLATNPDKQNKLIDEIDRIIGNEKPSYDNVGKVEYLDMVINECCRYHTLAVRFDRQCDKTVEVNGVLIKKGWNCVVPVYSIHHDPDIWEEPEKFIPERFARGNRESMHPCSFMPFGMGPRNCVAMRLALFEAKMVLASILQKIKFVPCEETETPIIKDMLHQAVNPIKLKVLRRN